MKIGIPKEIKNNETRVALTPEGVKQLTSEGHRVAVQQGAGSGAGFADDEYREAGALLLEDASEVWAFAELVMKVKEPLPVEYMYFRENLMLFCYLHLAADPELALALVKHKVTAIAYETVEVNRTYPLLAPMSEIAGRMAVQLGARLLEKPQGGKGLLLSGVPGVGRGRVTIIGGGVVGSNAAKLAIGMGADVTVIERDPQRLRYLDDLYGGLLHTRLSGETAIAEAVMQSDLVIGAVLVPGAKAPVLVKEQTVCQMAPGSVVVDVAIDQGGIFETVDRVTTHDDPYYVKHGVSHYAVPNIPGSVPRTATLALAYTTLPYVLKLASLGMQRAVSEDAALALGVNTARGAITQPAAARDLGYEHVPVADALAAVV
ncbi:alanine dehydrogenase [Paenibacillus sp. GD4]|jgi:alanine dehydrogenase|uniref:alanine dehydrogenase n=1 Tax=Paenibacillus sp. GD4 TaxID=3068890 RepID=UPI0027968540|nr:alanine dehydrogenase [Paenibacillus sp. GD4]MDQ1914344.1 alanine dehydrogenase [Paenibacillus sp. GD4]